MSKVFVVADLNYDACYYEGDTPDLAIHGVFSTREKAEVCAKAHGIWKYHITEIELE